MSERTAEYTVSPGLGRDAVAIVPPTEGLPIWCSAAPGPRPYRLALVDDLDSAEETTFARLDRVDAVMLAPSEVADRLNALTEWADLARQRPDVITPDGALRLIRDRLEELAWKVIPS